jgi:hypothetical protein
MHSLNYRLACRAKLALALSLAVCLYMLATTALAQISTSSIAGNVVDPHGAVIPEAKVIVRNTDLSLTRILTTDKRGAFRVAGLVSGAYVVEANRKDLVLRRPLRLTLGLGSSTEVTLRLGLRVVRQSTTVTARLGTVEGNTTTPPPNTAEASGSSFVAGLTVTYLPNRDRDFTQFTQLSPAAEEDAVGTGVVMAGQRSNAIVTEVDGTRFNDPLLGGRRGAEDGSFFLPLTVVREFQIVRTGVTASVGDTNAGLINVVTKEGSNRPRGEAFYTGRPSTFTSADAFGHSMDNQQNAFGISYGGPIRKDHTFFYFGIEQDFVHSPFYAEFAPQASTATISSSLIAQQGQIVQKDTPTAVFGRFDAILNPTNTLNVQLAANRVRSTNVGDGLTRTLSTSAHASSLSGQSFSSRVGLTSVVNARAVNQAFVAWSEDHRNRTPNSTAPELSINGFGTLGGDSAGRHLYTSQQVQLVDDLSLTRGRSLFAVGGNFALDPAYEQKEANFNGRFDYNSLTDYLNSNPRRFQQTFTTGDRQYHATVHELSLYADSNIQLHPRLHLSAGLRWAAQWNPQPAHPNAAVAQTQFIPRDLRQWQPRLGLAYTPDKKTVIRVSSGLYAAPTPATFFHRIFADNGTHTVVADSYFDPSILTISGGHSTSPHALAGPPIGLTTPAALVVGIDANFRNPMSLQAAASIDREIIPKLAFTLGYLHNSTWGLQRRVDENLNAPTIDSAGTPIFTSTRPLVEIGRLLVNQSTAHSSYEGGFLTATSAISRRSQLVINYSLSLTHDDDSNTGPYSYDLAVDPYDLHRERAYSSMDTRQVLNLSAIFNLPAGLKINPIFIARSGQPYTPLVGFDTQHDANDWNDRAIINGSMSARNSFRQPAFSDLDFRIVKDFTLKGEGHHLDLFMDIFNLANAQNLRFDPSSTSLFGSSASPVFSAGQPLFAPGAARFGGPRELQFTARLVGF